jgi:hypothetical protein
VAPWANYFEFIGIAIGQTRNSHFGNLGPKETVTMFLNVKLEREWIFNVVNDKRIQFKTEFGTADRTERNHSEKLPLNITFYLVTCIFSHIFKATLFQ